MLPQGTDYARTGDEFSNLDEKREEKIQLFIICLIFNLKMLVAVKFRQNKF